MQGSGRVNQILRKRVLIIFPGIHEDHCFLCLRSLDEDSCSLDAKSNDGRDGSKVGEDVRMVPAKIEAAKDETNNE